MEATLVLDEANSNILTLRFTQPLFNFSTRSRQERDRRSAHNQIDSRLLTLPAEVRILIYEHVLLEKRKWDKRHLPFCSSYAEADKYECPPFVLHNCRAAGAEVSASPKPVDESADSRYSCIRRKGLGLLSVCKQIYTEASGIFYQDNTFCFDTAKSFVQSHHLLPDAARSQIRRVSIMELASSFMETTSWTTAMLSILASMPGLREVELTAQHFLYLSTGSLSRLRKLGTIRILETETGSIWRDYHRDRAYFALTRDLTVPVCTDEKHWAEPTCDSCDGFFSTLKSEARQVVFAYGEHWWQVVQSRLAAKHVIQRNVDVPHTMSIHIAGIGKTRATVWGLPRQTPKMREEEERKASEAELRKLWGDFASLAGWNDRGVKYVTEEEEEQKQTLRGRSAKHWRHQQEEQKKDRETMLQQRSNRRANVVKREAVLYKEAKKKQAASKSKAIEEARAERKAVNKRSGRRSNI